MAAKEELAQQRQCDRQTSRKAGQREGKGGAAQFLFALEAHDLMNNLGGPGAPLLDIFSLVGIQRLVGFSIRGRSVNLRTILHGWFLERDRVIGDRADQAGAKAAIACRLDAVITRKWMLSSQLACRKIGIPTEFRHRG